MKLSIITVNLNNLEGLKKTINSVLQQNVYNFEYIIIDGASSDGSIEYVKQLLDTRNKNYPKMRFNSEPDRGIYQAMNKAIKIALGEYLLFLNSGDCLAATNVISKFLSINVTADIVAGMEKFESGNIYIPPNKKELTYDVLVDCPLMHQSTFIKRNAFERIGLYNEKYKIVSDWEWWIKALIINNCTYETLDFLVSIFDESGVSSPRGLLWGKHQQEIQEVNSLILPRVYPLYEEVVSLRQEKQKFEHLKNGKLRLIIKLYYKFKKKLH